MPPNAAQRRAAGGRHRADAAATRNSAYVPTHRSHTRRPRLRLLLSGAMALTFVAMNAIAVTRLSSSAPAPVDAIDMTALAAERQAMAENQLSRSGVDRLEAGESAVPSPNPSKKPTARPNATKKQSNATKKPTSALVAGLDRRQMNNAAAIARVGRDLGLPRRALIIGVATALQESNLYNVASPVVPESMAYPHEGVGYDHDSVGVFQQRPSQGWGTVADLMKPAYQARQFFVKLARIDWRNMSLTQAAQAVQVSAFPDAYAKHEQRATTIVDALS